MENSVTDQDHPAIKRLQRDLAPGFSEYDTGRNNA